jgi:hypothetical protein
MATWHQKQAGPVRLDHDKEWTVVIDPPNLARALYRTSSKALCDVYLRGLKDNNPHLVQYAYILRPCKR